MRWRNKYFSNNFSEAATWQPFLLSETEYFSKFDLITVISKIINNEKINNNCNLNFLHLR